MHPIRLSLAILAAATLAACATQPDQPEQPGRHMVVRDLGGKLLMQFDYPADDLCAKTSRAMRGSIYKANCTQASEAEPLRGQATLRYNPPGVLVQGHYADLALCRTQTSQPSAGVEIITACSAK
jgi:hypothetical protein